ncbi:hypothetical protein [Citrobacter freundii]|uniref:Uncharacterized protein n=1 Tax=Citrobacter freundii TaxID=546 RepID=A0A7G2IYC8_CITFR|nr:hypothetical protein [Citrobacter freundii]
MMPKNADSVNQNNALSRSSTEGDQTAAFTLSAVAGERFYPRLDKHQR